MRNRILCVLACYAGVSWATFAAAQPATSGTDGQAKTAPTPAQTASGVSTNVSAPAVDEQKKDLDALHKAEAGPVVPEQIPPANESARRATQDKEAQLIKDQKQRKADEKKAAAEQALATEAQKKGAAEQLKIAEARKKEAAKQARMATAQEKEAASRARKAMAREEAAAHKKAVEEARRVERLKIEMQNKSAPVKTQAGAISNSPGNGAPGKEQRLNELLRRYNADEITPYEYHMERARIIAEP